MNPPVPGWKPIQTETTVAIPDSEGAIAYQVTITVPAWQDDDGEVYFATEAQDLIDSTKARHMGLLSADKLKALRQRLRLSQAEISKLLQIGEKSWTRWESGKEYPTRSMNVLIRAFHDGMLTISYLQSLHPDSAQKLFPWDHVQRELTYQIHSTKKRAPDEITVHTLAA